MSEPSRNPLLRPQPHWLLLALAVLTLVMALLLGGFVAHEVGEPGPPHQRGRAAPALAGPILQWRNGRLAAREAPDHTAVLTFEDGPDPRRTPRLVALLHKLGVPATFFVNGTEVLAHPSLVSRELSYGNQIGSLTFSHADLTTLPSWQRNLQISLVQLSLASSSSSSSALVRPPYVGGPDGLTVRQRHVIVWLAKKGYLVVLADRQAGDWGALSDSAVVANALPPAGRGSVIGLHDGGPHPVSLAAVQQLVQTLRSRGYRFATVTGAVKLPATAGVGKVSTGAHLQAVLFSWAVVASTTTAVVVTWMLVPLGILTVLRTLFLLRYARRHSLSTRRRRPTDDFFPPVSIIVPAYNEEAGIAAAVRSLAASDYPDFDIVIVDDGSTDSTAEIVDGLGLDGVRLVRQPNAGKPAALNRGLASTDGAIVVMVDGDTVFTPHTLRRLVAPFADPEVGAVSGNTKVANRGSILGLWQHIEYVVGFNLDRRMYDLLRCMPTVPGAIGAFRRIAVDEVGGVSADTLAEDTDLTMALGRYGWRVVYQEDALAWTEAPATLNGLWRQRYRWSYGTLQSMWKHRQAIRHGGNIGRFGLPYLFLFQVLLPALAPLIDVFALYGILFLDPARVITFWLAFLALQLIAGAYAFRLDGERLRPLWALATQQFVYRQLMYLVVIQSVAAAIRGTPLRWHKIHRTGAIEDLDLEGAAVGLTRTR